MPRKLIVGWKKYEEKYAEVCKDIKKCMLEEAKRIEEQSNSWINYNQPGKAA